MERLPSPLQTASERSSSTSLCPERRKSWKQAETRTRISPAMVEGRKTPREQAPEIEEILSSAQLIVFYGKDIPAFLKKSGITLPQTKTLDLAHEFSEAHGAYGPGNRLLEGLHA